MPRRPAPLDRRVQRRQRPLDQGRQALRGPAPGGLRRRRRGRSPTAGRLRSPAPAWRRSAPPVTSSTWRRTPPRSTVSSRSRPGRAPRGRGTSGAPGCRRAAGRRRRARTTRQLGHAARWAGRDSRPVVSWRGDGAGRPGRRRRRPGRARPRDDLVQPRPLRQRRQGGEADPHPIADLVRRQLLAGRQRAEGSAPRRRGGRQIPVVQLPGAGGRRVGDSAAASRASRHRLAQRIGRVAARRTASRASASATRIGGTTCSYATAAG